MKSTMSHLRQSQSEQKHVGHSNLSSDIAGTSSEHSFTHDLNSKWQKWRSWWSKKTSSVRNASTESSESDVESLINDDVSVFMKARCRMMRIVGKLDNVFTGIQHVHTERYGHSEVEDTSRHIRLRMRDRAPGLETQRWELMLLINAVDMMHRKVKAIRSLSISYKTRMGERMHRQINEDNKCLIETRIEKTDSDNNLDISTKTQMEPEQKKTVKNPFKLGFAYILSLLCSAFFFIIGKSTNKTSEKASPITQDLASRLVEEAFNRKRDHQGLEDSAPSNSWMLLTVTSYPRNGIVQRCVNLQAFLRSDRSSTIEVKRITSATDKTQDIPTIRKLKKTYLRTIEFFGEIRACAYMVRLLGNIDAELFEAQEGLDAINDKPFKRSRPYSDRGALLRQALTRGEVELERKQIANTSSSRQELLTKDGLTEIVLRLEAKVEGIHMRYDGWRRAREMPGRRHKTGGELSVKNAVRLETEMCFRQTSGGLVVKRICVAKKKSFVERAFGGHTVNGLNVVPFLNT